MQIECKQKQCGLNSFYLPKKEANFKCSLNILDSPFKKTEHMHIAIAGNIGSGKTTLTKLLSKHYRWQAHYEEILENPYLDDFYHEMERWSFNLQIYFLNSRFGQLLEIQKSGEKVIQDRTIYEDAYIFAPNLHAMVYSPSVILRITKNCLTSWKTWLLDQI